MKRFTPLATILGSFLTFAGISHLTFNRKEFEAQVPDFVPLTKDQTVVSSGIVEVTLGTLLTFLKNKKFISKIVALFFIAIFPGNLNQYFKKIDAFGLNTDTKRLIRLFFQPLLVWLALKSPKNSTIKH